VVISRWYEGLFPVKQFLQILLVLVTGLPHFWQGLGLEASLAGLSVAAWSIVGLSASIIEAPDGWFLGTSAIGSVFAAFAADFSVMLEFSVN
jgi:hypothetical protein